MTKKKKLLTKKNPFIYEEEEKETFYVYTTTQKNTNFSLINGDIIESIIHHKPIKYEPWWSKIITTKPIDKSVIEEYDLALLED